MTATGTRRTERQKLVTVAPTAGVSVRTYRDDGRLTVTLVGLITEVSPPAVRSSIITVATLEASVMHSWTFF